MRYEDAKLLARALLDELGVRGILVAKEQATLGKGPEQCLNKTMATSEKSASTDHTSTDGSGASSRFEEMAKSRLSALRSRPKRERTSRRRGV